LEQIHQGLCIFKHIVVVKHAVHSLVTLRLADQFFGQLFQFGYD